MQRALALLFSAAILTPMSVLDAAEPATLDFREPMSLAAHAVAQRLDPNQRDRPWFELRGQGGIPVAAEYDKWDFADMTGRYLEGFILARQMGVSDPALSDAEGRLQRDLLSLLGPDGLVHNAVLSLDPPGTQAPLYAGRRRELAQPAPLSAPRYP
jgi:hypothetical protein